ncbi:Polymerase/histidinol phosphatase-like protein [Lentinula edodes]|uniref:Polymerase/histidinol phosphatase-like protein n=1 Tax=Lentinula edodes TaxID=5353 RepID=UPI001E8DD328|nr:Polymerase/histidinol phosphatase-like protein [Lentinula edodes]KAH7870501.1 Polymerase/histidinol phosphatase-like protein [Lentinula edodes]KAJ3877774.1 Polymerase/histidinol phosphatase-like protein [Lentinula edodes]KAJ3906552.1 Polymerase/histidinol phosphatase-like protein [Lentinula edodes]KAJ3917224.1 Polymerase/histidinol phosphatase-like protein [Lentinula edodes]
MPYSHHSHSGQFCRHAAGSLEDVVLEAIRSGFEVYGLTEHVPRYRIEDLYPEEAGMDLQALHDQFDAFVYEAHRLKARYASQITLLVGLETDYITSIDLDQLDALLERNRGRIEYIVGSIHHVGEIPIDFDVDTFRKSLAQQPGTSENERMENFLCRYFDAQFHVLQRFHPELIGHLDLCRLYHPEIRLSDYSRSWKRLKRNISYAIEYGALFEVNAAAFRKNWNTAYPAEDLLKVILQDGGRLALSDDSHGPHAVGLNYRRLLEYLRREGVSELWYLQFSESPNKAGRNIQAVKAPGEWWNHSFWNKE